jgi:uroporphyrinogen III methyltransferase / synthase
VNGVHFFMQRLLAAGKDVRELKGVKLAAIGPKTAEALETLMLRPDLVPDEYRAEGILEAFAGADLNGKRFLMPRALAAREILPEKLREWGADVDVVPAYQTLLPEENVADVAESFRRGEIDCLTFTSSSTVSNFFSLIEKENILPQLHGTTIASIGPITAETAAKYGLKTSIMPSAYTIRGLTDCIVSFFKDC